MSRETSTATAIAAPDQTPAAQRAAAPAAKAADREVQQTALLIAGAVFVGGILQIFIAPGPWALVIGASIAGLLIFALSQVLPGRWRETLAGFRFTATLLAALSACAVLGTLIIQNKTLAFYESRYRAIGSLIWYLGLEDIFHSLWFAGFVALFLAAALNSALLRWPLKLKNAGFFVCHLGLLTCMAGAGASAALSVRGRVDLHAGGETARQVMVTRAGIPTGRMEPLGFDLRLDRFNLVHYQTEYRIAYYEQRGPRDWRLRASFDPEVGVKHRLPSGDSFRMKSLDPDLSVPGAAAKEMKNPAAVLEVTIDGMPRETSLLLAERHDFTPIPGGVLVFERREDEVKAFRSEVTATAGAVQRKAVVSVNDPFDFNGWTFYQVNFDPKDPSYSGLEAVHDPGVQWVFLGFGLISLGVAYMFYVENRLKRRRP